MKGVTEGKEPGTEYQARWAETANTFKASGMLQQNASIEGAYTNQFIKQCHDFDQAAVIKQAKESAENK